MFRVPATFRSVFTYSPQRRGMRGIVHTSLMPRAVLAIAGALALGACTISDLVAPPGITPMPSTPASTPNQLRYRDANARLAMPDREHERVVFFGDSITEGWLQTMPGFFSGKPYVDRGISGETSGQMLLRFDQDVIALIPRVVVILAGTNDIAGNDGPYNENATRRNLETMAERARANGIRVVMASLVPARDYPWRPGLDPAPKIVALNAWIRQYAAKQGLTYLDYFTAMSDSSNGLKPNLGNDGVHPNLAGYQVMAPLAERAVRDALRGNVPLSAPVPSPLPY